jgi:hypothetical protein
LGWISFFISLLESPDWHLNLLILYQAGAKS